ncbi:acyl carrier protein [Azospirillum halopraeferens]|uniref:acyl carrier protein n=1 Tax=Azospirillum halopraeferens TaxID=34010 RepID=UPI0004262F09|nr:phosphopantetheine-binding protein [Azospirillum halopraeferens]
MTSPNSFETTLMNIFATDLNVAVPDPETDLIETGLINSVTFVELVMILEERFQVTVPLDEMELDQLRTVDRIAALVADLARKPDTAAA